MANYDLLITALENAIKTNGTGAITGAVAQAAFLNVVESLTVGFQFMGVATPSTSPDSNDKKEFYIGFAGTYANFGSSVTVPEGSIILFKKNEGAWSSQVVKIADPVSVSQNTETGKEELLIGDTPALILDNVPEVDSDNLVKSGGVYAAFCDNSSGVFVKGSLLKISKFFRELYIVPQFPESFDITEIKKVSIYRDKGSNHLWYIGFYDSSNNSLSNVSTNTSEIEEQDVITLSPDTTNNRFTAYAVVDWSLLENDSSIYMIECQVNDIAQNIKNTPYINFLQNVYPKSDVYPKSQVYSKTEIDGTFDEVPNQVAENILFNLDNANLDYISLASGASLLERTLTLTTSATATSYIGTKTVNIYPSFTNFFGKWIRIHLKAKVVSGDINDVTLNNINIYPGTIDKRNKTIIVKGDCINYYLDVKFENNSDTSGQLYVSFEAKNNASGPVSVEIQDFYYSLVTDSDEDITNHKELLTSVLDKMITEHDIKLTHIYCYAHSGTNDNTHFYGITSISDALNAINDNDYYNRYLIHISGQYHFTNTSQLIMPDILGGSGREYSVIEAKPYISFEGEGIDKTVLFVDLPAGGFGTLDYSHYQPIYVECDGEVSFSNMTVIGKNCRYTIHLEIERSGSGFALRNFKDMRVIHLGLDGLTTLGFEHAFGCGMGSGHIWNIEDCYMESPTGDFRVHNNLHDSINQGTINFTNCKFGKTGFGVDTYSCMSDMNVNMVGCSFAPSAVIANTTRQYGNHKFANSSKSIIKASTPAVIYDDHMGQCKVIRINAIDTSKEVSFDITASAFNTIIGDSTLTGKFFTDEAVWTQYGCFYRKGFAYGSIDIDTANGNRSIGKLLGDCTGTNKVLMVVIDNASYSVTFNENYTNATNDYIIGKINDVLDGIGTAEVFSINKEYYPQFDGLIYRASDESEILAGMGVIFTNDGIKKAKSSDGYIDGVCLDTIHQGEVARVLTKGVLWTKGYASGVKRFKILETENSGSTTRGTSLGISPTQDGYFDTNAETKLIRCVLNNQVDIKP